MLMLSLTLLASTVALATSSHATDVCIGEGTFNITSTAILDTPEGNFTLDFLFMVNITRSDNVYNVSVVGVVTNITGPPVLLQAKLPLFDFDVSTEDGVYRWSDGKVFAAVMLPLSSDTAYRMSLMGIRSSCIRSITIDASGLGLPDIVAIGEGGVLSGYMLGTSGQTVNGAGNSTESQSTPTVTYLVTATYTEGAYGRAQPGNAAFAGIGSTTTAEEGIEKDAIAALIAALAAIGVGLLLYTLFT